MDAEDPTQGYIKKRLTKICIYMYTPTHIQSIVGVGSLSMFRGTFFKHSLWHDTEKWDQGSALDLFRKAKLQSGMNVIYNGYFHLISVAYTSLYSCKPKDTFVGVNPIELQGNSSIVDPLRVVTYVAQRCFHRS